MSNELKQLLDSGVDLQYALKRFLEKYREAEVNMDRSVLTVEERSDYVVLYQASDKISDAYRLLKTLDKPIRADGILVKNSNGRYEVNGIELTSGSSVEFFSDDEDGGCYVPSRIEHNGEDYYIYDLGRDENIEGVRVRIK